MSTIAVVWNASDGMVLMKYGNDLPSESSGLVACRHTRLS